MSDNSSSVIRWLHLSDLHLKGLERWERRSVLEALLRHVGELKKHDLAPDLLFVTGDIAWSGKRKEYEQAELFLRRLCKELELEPREHLFLVPGNHDVDRAAIGPADGFILESLRDEEAVEQVLQDPGTMQLLSRRLEAFYAFTERLLGTARAWRNHRPWRVDVVEVEGLEVAVLQFNSAWTSGRPDLESEEGKLLVGEVQVREGLLEAAETPLRVALIHHPLSSLAEFDRARLETLLAAEGGAQFLLRGHLHRSRTGATTTPDGVLTELAAGATYTEGGWPMRYLLGEANLATGQGTVRYFRYSDEGRGFWAPDPGAYEGAQDGVWTFDLPLELHRGGGPKAVPKALTEARRETLVARFRGAAAAVHGTVRFVGFADSRPRPNVRVPELFVPLRLETSEGDNKKAAWSTADLLHYLLPGKKTDKKAGKGKEAPRVVVLGDPGCGKTTLCRFLTVAIAGEAPAGFEIAGEPLPLFLPFRDYVRVCREEGDRSLLAFLVGETRHHLQVAVDEGFLEDALDRGAAVLLLDGMDEVGAAGERETMRDRVQGFCRLYPRVPVLVTSRVAGYADAPLVRSGPGAFHHCRVAPFGDQELEEFVSHWYAVQEPDDPVARNRGIADLSAALAAGPHIRGLAGNPMLATLIALVHRYEAHLPGERAELYKLCIKTMVETWPAARKRRFRAIDEKLQNAYLEALAYRMQTARKRQEKSVVIEKKELVSTLTAIVLERGSGGDSHGNVEAQMERWVSFIAEGTGLLVEQQPGVFTFFHLSLMEYLAAQEMARVEKDLVAAIVQRLQEPTWREVCLLAVGSRATEKGFLDQLFTALKKKKAWDFLLLAMKEEAAFDDRQREEIVGQSAAQLLNRWAGAMRETQRTFDEIRRLSLRHQEWSAAWLDRETEQATGDRLRALVCLRLPEEPRLLGRLKQRKDRDAVALSLLDFWPKKKSGQWAAGAVSFDAALDWGTVGKPQELLVIRGLAGATLKASAPRAGLLVGLLHHARRFSHLSADWIGALATQERQQGQGVPPTIQVKPGDLTLATGLRWPTQRTALADVSVQPELYFARYFARYFALDFARDFARYFALDFARYFARDFALDFALDFARYFAFAVASEEVSFPSPDQQRPSTLLQRLEALRGKPSEEEVQDYIRLSVTRRAMEVWIAAMTTVGQESQVGGAYAHHRLMQLFLLETWPALEDQQPDTPEPDRLALYLALGWTQATVTWEWPSSDRWQTVTGGPPPEHWLPRSQYHLCWLLYDPEDAAHRAGLDGALEEGLGDAQRPGLAVALRQVFPAV